jgi:hypothetical protein
MPARKLQAVPVPESHVVAEAQPPTAMSKKRDAFKRVVEKRIANAVNALEVLYQCADRTRYEIHDRDVAYIKKVVGAAYNKMAAAYDAGHRKAAIKLPD